MSDRTTFFSSDPAGLRYTQEMRWVLHDLIIEGTTNDANLANRWQRSFSPLPRTDAPPDLRCQIDLVEGVPSPPESRPIFVQQDLLSYYIWDDGIYIHFPEIGQLILDLDKGVTKGTIVRSCLDTFGLLEDIIASGLSPHLRRRGFFMIHAFAAAIGGRFALLVGDIGAGKTTAGIALLDNGWQLMSNDSPIVASSGRVLSYPGFLAAYPDTLAMFASTRDLVTGPVGTKQKNEFAAEGLWPDVWFHEARAGVILFPQIHDIGEPSLEPLSKAEALGRLLPHTIDRWDEPMQSTHLAVIGELVESSPSYLLRVGRDLKTLPDLIGATLGPGG
ncbi:MAG: hypothetical protein WA996_18955 [Candidatus Promineifilaceae bacterium]